MASTGILDSPSLGKWDSAIQSPPEDHNRYVWLQLDEAAASAKKKEYFYKAAAGTAMVVAGLAIIALTVLAAVFQQYYLIPVPLLFGGGACNVLYSKVFTPLLEKGHQARKEYDNIVAIQSIVESIRSQNLGYYGYENLLRNLGISTWEIQHLEQLGQFSSTGNSLESLTCLIGRIIHWGNRLHEIKPKLVKVRDKIALKNQELLQPDLTEAQKKTLRQERRELKIKLLRLEQEEALPVKLAAAYDRHVLCDVHDKREFTAFGHPSALNYIDVLENQVDGTSDDYFYFPEGSKTPPLSKQWLLKTPISDISKRIFAAQAA